MIIFRHSAACHYTRVTSCSSLPIRSCLSQYRFKSNTHPSSTNNTPSSPSNGAKKHEPKTLLEEMKLAEQSRRVEPPAPRSIPPWIKRELTQKSKYNRWNPKRKLSRQEMIKVKELKETFPQYRTVDLAQFFHISPEAVRRILKSKWVPNDIDEERITQRREKKLLQKQESRRVYNESRGGSKLQSRRKRSHKTDNDDDELNKNYNRIQSQF
ncbi:RRG9 [Candida metapsilosis]|uniref:Required for respiratory growth protein 9, mitochondrial n=1 Tax=Candida metapsilosis TaxID=273372 RepID=A0A8H7ZJV3_9ASCO|nr:RRG9 [Candida metapsilosis]